MSTISAGTTVGTALVNTGDTTGNLVLQTNGTTTAVTIGTNQVVTLAQALPIGSGGTGQSDRQAAMDALAGAVTNGQYLRGNGTDVVMAAIQAGDMTGTLAVANGGTGQTSLAANHALIGNGTSGVQAVAPGSSGNVLTSNGTTWTSAALPAGGVTSLNGQTGAITNTAYGAIGSYVTAYFNGSLNSNDTTAGSNLLRATNVRGGLNSLISSSADFAQPVIGAITSSTGTTSLSLSGTWRAMTHSSNSGGGWAMNLFVRIS